ncbi:MAG: DUF3883 domain-containing protein [Candidatus Scalindua sp.]
METIFNKITYHQIKTLINVVYSTTEMDYDFIRKKFQASADNFESVLAFLGGLKLLKTNNNEITITKVLKEFRSSHTLNDNLAKNFLLEKTLNYNNSFSKEIFQYLNNFNMINNRFRYKPTTDDRLRESGIRNLFIELDLIKFDNESQSYKVSDKYFETFATYIGNKKLTPKALLYLLKKQEELGEAAEFEIMKYEKKRLADYPMLLTHLEHISKSDVNAGYDIKSWEIGLTNEPTPRYIEVKAVSKYNYKFNWTRNEVEKASLHQQKYFLYLLPVIGNKVFDMDGLEIIPNPIEGVFDNSKSWNRQVETYLFSKTGK